MDTLFFQFRTFDYLFLFFSACCITWIILDWYNFMGQNNSWSNYFFSTLIAGQTSIAIAYILCDARIKVFIVLLMAAGIYLLLRALCR